MPMEVLVTLCTGSGVFMNIVLRLVFLPTVGKFRYGLGIEIGMVLLLFGVPRLDLWGILRVTLFEYVGA